MGQPLAGGPGKGATGWHPPREGGNRAPGGGAALGDPAAEQGERRSRLEESPARLAARPGAVQVVPAFPGGRAQGPRAPRGAVPAERREARPRQGPARGFPAGHRTPVQTAEAGAAVQPRPRPAAGAAMSAVPGPDPAPTPLRPFQPRAPVRDPGTVGVPPPAAGLALLGGRGPGEVSSAPLNLSPVCLAGSRSPQGARWRVVWAPSPGQ